MFEICVTIFAITIGFLCVRWFVRKYPQSFLRPNFQGAVIPTGYGLVVIIGSIIFYGSQIARNWPSINYIALYFLEAIAGFGVLGLVDDLAGNRSVGGLKGHFAELLKGKVTTGVIKALGGLAIAAIIAWRISGWSLSFALITIIIAGSANAINLVDLRPARAISMFALFSIPVAIVAARLIANGHWTSAMPEIFILACAAALLPRERKARFMLGDTGSNALGAGVGVAWAVYITDERVLAVFAALLLLFHIWTENNSFSAFIKSNQILRRIDRKLGVR